MRSIRDMRGMELRVARAPSGHALVVQTTPTSTRTLDRVGVRALLDVIASSPTFRNEMRDALDVYDVRARASSFERGRR